MLSSQVLARLRELNRRPLPPRALRGAANNAAETAPAEPQTAEFAVTTAPTRPPSGAAQAPHPPSAGHSRADWETEEVRETPWGPHWVGEIRVSQLWPDCDSLVTRGCSQWKQRFAELANTESSPPRAHKPQAANKAAGHRPFHQELRTLGSHFPSAAIYLDLETCGFAGTAVFLAGVIHQADPSDPASLTLTQLLARNYAEEKAMLQSLWDLTAGKRVLVTFNGKSFDWPVVHDRSTLHHLGQDPRFLRPPAGRGAAPEFSAAEAESPTVSSVPWDRQTPRPDPIHCDLLHHCRRRWRHRLPNCKLQTLEQYLCGRKRSGDVPGSMIPQVYHQYVQTGEFHEMRTVLRHNALDLVTLLQLSICISAPEPLEPAEECEPPETGSEAQRIADDQGPRPRWAT